MRDLDNIRKLYFLGIGGIGMSALARYFYAKGVEIKGYDKTPTSLTRQLESEGMDVHYEDDPSRIDPDTDMVIFTPAVPLELNEFNHIVRLGFPLKKRAEVLGMITAGKRVIAVAGTHGKTSVSSLIAHLLKEAGIPVIALIGGISKNYGTNFIAGEGADPIFVVEADEFDRSFLSLNPDVAVVSSMDADHLDIYTTHGALEDSFRQFAGRIKKGGILVAKSGLDLNPSAGSRKITYGLEGNEEITAGMIRVSGGKHSFEIIRMGKTVGMLSLGIPGRHNIENALAAYAVSREIGIAPDKLLHGLSTYQGVNRRFDIRVKLQDKVYIDDYAHHPRELQAFISAVREILPGRKITGIFQPHLYSRTRDFAEGFARSLDLLDEVFLMDIYPAREEPLEGVSSAMILSRMKCPMKAIASREEIIRKIESTKPEILLTMGAGDIDQLVPVIEKIYNG